MDIETDYEPVDVPECKTDVPKRKQRVCPECDTEFAPRYGSQVCCSDKCR